MDFKELVAYLIESVITPITILIFAGAVVVFMWNIMEVIRKGSQPEEVAKLKTKAVWGIIGLAVMVSMWGLVNFVTDSLQLDNETPINIPIPPFQ